MAEPLDNRELSLTVVNARNEIERASAWLNQIAAEAAVPSGVTGRLLVALDEVLSNIITHALAGVPEGQREIWLRLRLRADRLELDVSDDGPAFDPTRVVPVPRSTRMSRRQEGGVGLLFVRTLIDDVRFTRQDGRNCLTLLKRLAVPA